MGGLGLVNPTKEVEIKQANLQHVTAPLVIHIVEQDENISDISKRNLSSVRERHTIPSASIKKNQLPH